MSGVITDDNRFQGAHFPKNIILYAIFFYVRYPVSYRDLQEILAERGVSVDHPALNRWVIRYLLRIAAQAQMRKRCTARSWGVDETHLKVRGKWTYLYRAVDRDGQTLDFMLSGRRDLATARRFFKNAIATNSVPERVVIDKSGSNLAGLQAVNTILKFTGPVRLLKSGRSNTSTILEQDHRFIKLITKQKTGFKAFHSASATLAGIEVAHMIRKNQFDNDNRSPFEVFAELTA